MVKRAITIARRRGRPPAADSEGLLDAAERHLYAFVSGLEPTS
jgi:hypothetical protein